MTCLHGHRESPGTVTAAHFQVHSGRRPGLLGSRVTGMPGMAAAQPPGPPLLPAAAADSGPGGPDRRCHGQLDSVKSPGGRAVTIRRAGPD